MPIDMRTRFKNSWNAFFNRSEKEEVRWIQGEVSYGRKPDRNRLRYVNQKSIIAPIYNRIATDVASLTINHVKLDENKRFKGIVYSDFNECLTLSANLDQTGRAFIQDVVISMLDEGCVAIVPVDTDRNIFTGSFDILSLRVGKIVDWYPSAVKVDLYNERTGRREQIIVPKVSTAIVENPFYEVMNEQNSTLSRLKRKLALIDIVDEKNSSAKLDLIVQLPYVVKGQMKEKQAEKSIRELEDQLANSKYGIGYIDATQRVTQLNRPLESNLLKHVEYLTNMLYGQLGISEAIMNGTADEREMLNYNNRTIEPIISAIVNEMTRKFLTKTARTQGQSIMFFRDPFKLVPVENVAEIADKFTRNEIMTSNEFRQVIGMKPSDDPKADELRNANISEPTEEAVGDMLAEEVPTDEGLEEENLEEAPVDESSEESPVQSGGIALDTPIAELMR